MLMAKVWLTRVNGYIFVKRVGPAIYDPSISAWTDDRGTFMVNLSDIYADKDGQIKLVSSS